MPGSRAQVVQEVLGVIPTGAIHALIGITRIATAHGVTVTREQEAHGATLPLVILPLVVHAAVDSPVAEGLVTAVGVAVVMLVAADTEDDKII